MGSQAGGATGRHTATHRALSRLGNRGFVEVTAPPRLTVYLLDVWRRRHLAWGLARADLRAKNVGTFLGGAWHVLTPALLTGTYYVVFAVIVPLGRGPSFLAFLTVGVFQYSLTQRAVTNAAASVVNNAGLTRALRFPRALLPLSSVMRESTAYLWSLTVVLAVVTASGFRPSDRWLMLLPSLGLQLAFTFGLALIVARLGGWALDIERVMPLTFRVLFYLSGVLFPVERFVEGSTLRSVFVWNPLFVFIALPRRYLMDEHRLWSASDLWTSAASWAAVTLITGLLVFWRGERRIPS